MTKTQKICEEYGDLNDIFREAVFDGICPSICINEGCDIIYDYEPDCTDGWCEACETNSVKSILVLEGMI